VAGELTNGGGGCGLAACANNSAIPGFGPFAMGYTLLYLSADRC